jgi:hypothetical protein
MNKFKKEVSRYFNFRNVLILLIFLVVSLIWFRYIAGLVLIAVFAPITFLTVRYSKMVPHISAESNTGMSILMGYIFGPVFGFFYGLAVGGFSYVMNSFISATYLSTVFLGGVAGFLSGTLHSMNLPFTTAFVLSVLFRTMIAWPIFGFFGIDPFERFTHQTSQLLTNLIIYLPLLSLIYQLVSPFI